MSVSNMLLEFGDTNIYSWVLFSAFPQKEITKLNVQILDCHRFVLFFFWFISSRHFLLVISCSRVHSYSIGIRLALSVEEVSDMLNDFY